MKFCMKNHKHNLYENNGKWEEQHNFSPMNNENKFNLWNNIIVINIVVFFFFFLIMKKAWDVGADSNASASYDNNHSTEQIWFAVVKFDKQRATAGRRPICKYMNLLFLHFNEFFLIITLRRRSFTYLYFSA